MINYQNLTCNLALIKFYGTKTEDSGHWSGLFSRFSRDVSGGRLDFFTNNRCSLCELEQILFLDDRRLNFYNACYYCFQDRESFLA